MAIKNATITGKAHSPINPREITVNHTKDGGVVLTVEDYFDVAIVEVNDEMKSQVNIVKHLLGMGDN